MDSKFKSISKNLRLLSGYYPSIAQICRDMVINRQQFNKYLTGASVPSVRNIKKIADFFGVTESELMLPAGEFEQLMSGRSATLDNVNRSKDFQDVMSAYLNPPPDSQASLEQYCGYYFHYNVNPVWQDHINKCLIHIYQNAAFTFWDTFENVTPDSNRIRGDIIIRQRGLVTYCADRIIVIEGSYFPKKLTQGMSIFYPNHRSELKYLTGLLISITGSGRRTPFSARVVLEFLGKVIDESEVMKKVGTFHKNANEHVDPQLLEKIINEIYDEQQTLLPVNL